MESASERDEVDGDKSGTPSPEKADRFNDHNTKDSESDRRNQNKENEEENEKQKENEEQKRKKKENEKQKQKEKKKDKKGEENERENEREKAREDVETKEASNQQRSSSDSTRTAQRVTPRCETSETEGRRKQREFFKLELARLETGLKRESSKIVQPVKRPYIPDITNKLKPYSDTYVPRYVIYQPWELKHGFTSRRTAQSLTDPWIDLRMDTDLLPLVPSKPVSRQVAILNKEKEIRNRKKRSVTDQSSSRKGGSTRLPMFPIVQLSTTEMATKQLNYNDMLTLRESLKNKSSSSARIKIAEDYERTRQDFYRMELDKVHPINRSNMRSAYFAYFQNTPGSKKAIMEFVRDLVSEKT